MECSEESSRDSVTCSEEGQSAQPKHEGSNMTEKNSQHVETLNARQSLYRLSHPVQSGWDDESEKTSFVLVSCGFDAHRADPLAAMEVDTEAYGEATRRLLELAEDCCDGRFVSVLEGGYDLEALGASAQLHLETLLD